MKYSLLDLVQNVLSSMDSDEINSIDDSVESKQVVKIIKNVYDDLVSRGELSVNKTLFTLDASGDSTKPVLMTIPTTIDRIDWIKYNKVLDGNTDPVWTKVAFMPLDEFMEMIHEFKLSDDNVDSMSHTANGFTFTFYYYNNTGPSFYTSFNDGTLIFDAYDSEVDTTLQSNKSLCYGSKITTFTETDGFIPDLQPHQFTLLLNEAKSLAWAELKQTTHPKAEQAARRNWVRLGRIRQNVTDDYVTQPVTYNTPNFGRK